MAKVLTEPPAPLEALRPDLPAPFLAVVARCLDKDPAKRFTTVVELARAIGPFATPPAEARVLRIEATSRNVSMVPPDRVSRESAALGVAATLPMTGSAWSASGGTPPKRRTVGIWIGVAAAIAVASVLFVGLRPIGTSPTAASTAPVATASPLAPSAQTPTKPGTGESAVPPPPAPSASAATPAAASTPVTAAPPSSGARPAPATHSPSARPAAHPAEPVDPFGNSRL
jgi:eukaryotic-like serine/threonine-protein kinase